LSKITACGAKCWRLEKIFTSKLAKTNGIGSLNRSS
jgi:hypothetical protein